LSAISITIKATISNVPTAHAEYCDQCMGMHAWKSSISYLLSSNTSSSNTTSSSSCCCAAAAAAVVKAVLPVDGLPVNLASSLACHQFVIPLVTGQPVTGDVCCWQQCNVQQVVL